MKNTSGFSLLIMCGGKGNRIKNLTTKYKCKSLIPINGKPILYYTLRYIKDVNFDKVFLCVDREELIKVVEKIVEKVGLKNFEIYKDSGKGPTPILFDLKEKLGKKTIVLCGNQPTPAESIIQFLKTDKKIVLGLYKETSDSPAMVARVKDSKILKLIEVPFRPLGNGEFYISRPYLLSRSFYEKEKNLEMRFENEFVVWLLSGRSIYGIPLKLPPEIHYESDLPQLKKFLLNNF